MLSDKIDIDPADIFGSTLHMVNYADHFSIAEIEKLRETYRSFRKDQDPALSMAQFESLLYAEHFEPLACPNCGEVGYFKWLALGRHVHAQCGHGWVESPWRTLWENTKRLFGPAKAEIKITMLLSQVFLPVQVVLYYLNRRKSAPANQ